MTRRIERVGRQWQLFRVAKMGGDHRNPIRDQDERDRDSKIDFGIRMNGIVTPKSISESG
jgi:hypothetical protein